MLKRKYWKIHNLSTEKEVREIAKNGEEVTKNISYILQFTESGKFIASSLSNLVNNVSEGVHKIKCNYRHNYKKYETCGITYES